MSGRGGANREVDSANAGKLLVDVALIEQWYQRSLTEGRPTTRLRGLLRCEHEHERAFCPAAALDARFRACRR